MKRIIGVMLMNYENVLSVYVEWVPDGADASETGVTKFREFGAGERDKAFALWSLISDYLADGSAPFLDDSEPGIVGIKRGDL